MADTNLLILAREFKKLRTHVQEVLKMPVGPQGLQGETGEQGVKGDTGAPGKDGKDGKDGVNGLNGQDGRNGVDGNDGKDGLDGVGVQNAYIDFDNSLVIVLTSGQEINAGFLSQETKDAVVATFKQGAQTLNELLPVQTGNANKFLKTDGENVSWDTLDGSDINLSSPPVIGDTTPNAATFTTLTATGQTSLGGAAGSQSLRVNTSGTAGAYLQLATESPGTSVFRSVGTNVGVSFVGTGTGAFNWATNGSASNIQMRVSNTASAVNYVQVTGAATGGQPVISAQGSDANVALRLSSKGSGPVDIASNGNPYALQVQGVASGSNYNQWRLTSGAGGSAASSTPVMSTWGSDTNISMAFQSKGTGAIDLAAGSSGVNISNGGTVTAITRTVAGTFYTSIPTLTISPPTTAGGVQATATPQMAGQTVSIQAGGSGYVVGNTLTVVGGTFSAAAQLRVDAVNGSGAVTATSFVNTAGAYSVLPTNPVSVTGGAGSGATFNITQWFFASAGPIITNAGSGYVEQPTVTFSGGGGSGAAAYATVGGTTVIKSIGQTGTASMDFQTPASASNNAPVLRLRDINTGSSSNTGYIQLQNANGYTSLLAQGPATTHLNIASNGDGRINFNTRGGGEITQMRVADTASAVNYVQVTGAATGASPTLSVQGSDTNIAFTLAPKGGGAINLSGVTRLGFNSTNYLTVSGAATTVAPSLTAGGGDTNIDLALTPKGTGNVRFGTYTASMALTIQGYVEIKDAGGTIRKLAVIA